MHLSPAAGRGRKKENCLPLMVYNEGIEPKKSIKSLGIRIDHCLNFRMHAAEINTITVKTCGWLSNIAQRKGMSPATMHNIIATTSTLR